MSSFSVRRPAPGLAVVDVVGDITPERETALMTAYGEAADGDPRSIVLNFTGLEYMNSGGIGLLVTLLVRAQRDKHRLLACGLSDHYRQILTLTRLDEAIEVHDTEDAAMAAVA